LLVPCPRVDGSRTTRRDLNSQATITALTSSITNAGANIRLIDRYHQRVHQVSALQTSMHLALDTTPGRYSCSTCVDAASVTYFDDMLQAPSGTITETMMQAI